MPYLIFESLSVEIILQLRFSRKFTGGVGRGSEEGRRSFSNIGYWLAALTASSPGLVNQEPGRLIIVAKAEYIRLRHHKILHSLVGVLISESVVGLMAVDLLIDKGSVGSVQALAHVESEGLGDAVEGRHIRKVVQG